MRWRDVWRWMTGGTLKDAVPEYNLEWWNGAVEFENRDLGSYVIGPEVLQSIPHFDWRAGRDDAMPVISTLHDSTMMARIDKGTQKVAWVPTAGVFPFVPIIIPDPPPDPYVWHDVPTLVDMANETAA